MIATYKKILALYALQEGLSKLNLSAETYLPVAKLDRTIKKLKPIFDEFQEMVEDLRLDNCYKEGARIVRVDGQLQWSAEGEKAFRKSYKELIEKEVELGDVQPMNYEELFNILPSQAKVDAGWEDFEETLSPFFTNK